MRWPPSNGVWLHLQALEYPGFAHSRGPAEEGVKRCRKRTRRTPGAGAHTTWMLRDTSLRSVQGLFIFDSRRTVASLDGLPVYRASDIPAMGLHVVIVSSLAFQDEMHAYLRSLDLPDVHIVVCYPQASDTDVAA